MAVYESMKDSGIEWIGKIPATWKTHTLYQLVTQVKNKNSDLSEQNLLSLSYGKIKRKDINSNGGLLPESFNGYNIIEDGDIVLRLTDLQNDHTSLRVGRATERGIITSAYTTLRPINKGSSKYLYYLLHCFDIKKGFYGMGSGVRQGLNYDEVKELRVIMPSSSTEQSAIAAYLDDQCAKIDTLIAEAKASIEEYKKWKASLIFEAVTKGLDPNAEMKDSGVDWIGKMPNNWNSNPIKQIIIRRNGGAWGDEATGDVNDRICMRIADFSFEQGRFKQLPSNKYTVRNYTSTQIERLTLTKGDICIEKSGGGEKTPVGRAVLYDLDYPALYANFMESISVNQEIVHPEFVEYYLRSMYFKTVTTAYIKQTTGIQNLNISSMFEKEYIVFPKKDIQESIVKHLDSICGNIDKLVTLKERLIADLESYKKSIIFETVTGKRKVV